MARLSATRPNPDRAALHALGAGILQLRVRPDRRNVTARNVVSRRILEAFLALPGTSLTEAQASRLFSIPRDRCVRILRCLAEEGLLRLSHDGRYTLPGARDEQRHG